MTKKSEQVKKWRVAHPVETKDRMANEKGKRQARKAGVFFHDVMKSDLFKRDKGICQLCLLPVDPVRYDMDHRIPIALGGEHTHANTWISHPRCNNKKRQKIVERGAYEVSIDLSKYTLSWI